MPNEERRWHYRFMSGERLGRLDWEASDDDDAPDEVSKPLVRELSAAFKQVLVKLAETEQLLEYERLKAKVPSPPRSTRLIGPAEAAVLDACASAKIERLSNGWRMLDGESNRAVAKAELARRQQQAEKERE